MADEDERVKAEKLAAAKKRVNSQLLKPPDFAYDAEGEARGQSVGHHG